MSLLFAHFIGDYVLQNHLMANTKRQSKVAALVHALVYTLPFVFITRSPQALSVIWLTHAVIDHYGIAGYWCRFWGVGCEGAVIGALMRLRGFRLRPLYPDHSDVMPLPVIGYEWVRLPTGDVAQRRPQVPDAPPFLAVWLIVINDNLLHIGINWLAATYL